MSVQVVKQLFITTRCVAAALGRRAASTSLPPAPARAPLLQALLPARMGGEVAKAIAPIYQTHSHHIAAASTRARRAAGKGLSFLQGAQRYSSTMSPFSATPESNQGRGRSAEVNYTCSHARGIYSAARLCDRAASGSGTAANASGGASSAVGTSNRQKADQQSAAGVKFVEGAFPPELAGHSGPLVLDIAWSAADTR